MCWPIPRERQRAKQNASPVIAFSAIAGKEVSHPAIKRAHVRLAVRSRKRHKATAAKRLGTVQIGIPAQ